MSETATDSTKNLLDNIRVAAPCSADWESMTGDQQSRFCAQCEKHVYNLSEMTATAAADLIREKEGKLCVRLYRRHDGTMLTADCPIGMQRIAKRMQRLITAGAAAIMLGVSSWLLPSVILASSSPAPIRLNKPGRMTLVYQDTKQAITEVIEELQYRLGIKKRPAALPLPHSVVMGDMACPVLPPTPPPPIAPPGSTVVPATVEPGLQDPQPPE